MQSPDLSAVGADFVSLAESLSRGGSAPPPPAARVARRPTKSDFSPTLIVGIVLVLYCVSRLVQLQRRVRDLEARPPVDEIVLRGITRQYLSETVKDLEEAVAVALRKGKDHGGAEAPRPPKLEAAKPPQAVETAPPQAPQPPPRPAAIEPPPPAVATPRPLPPVVVVERLPPAAVEPALAAVAADGPLPTPDPDCTRRPKRTSRKKAAAPLEAASD